MPGTRCALFGCNNSLIATKSKNLKIIYHKFPKGTDLASTTTRNEWVSRCKRAEKTNPNTSVICSAHFTEESYERDLQNELLGLPQRKVLKKTAVPIINLGVTKKIDQTQNNYNRLKRRKNKQRKGQVDILKTHEIKNITVPEEVSSADLGSSTAIDSSTSYKKEYEALLIKYNNLERNFKCTEEIYKRKIKTLNTKSLYLHTSLCCANMSLSNRRKAENVLKNILTKNQIELVLNKKKRVNWTSDEVSTAFTLRYYSKRAYLYIRNTLKYPLPGLHILRRWALKTTMEQGILKGILKFLSLAGENMSDFEKTVVLAFDEVKVKSIYEYDVALDKIIGPHKQLQVVMARGLFAKWKQPIFIGFDQTITNEILFSIITELHKISYNVVACVSDSGSSNVKLWKQLGVDFTNTSFKHPHTNRNIYMFVDAPHLLKLMRNWLLDTGFLLENNILINKKPLESLVEHTDKENNVCFKVCARHINVKKTLRQNVGLAAQLLSNTVGEALLLYKPGADPQLAQNVGKFVRTINTWFDIFNSNAPNGVIPTKCSFGTNLDLQIQHLHQMSQMVQNMRAIGKKTLQNFQKGILMSIKSLQQLFEDMRTSFDNVEYISTHKLNQDCLENLFFQIRGRGLDEHPTPNNAIKRMRLIILGKNPSILDNQVSTDDVAPEEYVSATVLNYAGIVVPDELHQ